MRKGRDANQDKETERVKTVTGCRTDMEEGKIGMGSRTEEQREENSNSQLDRGI